MWRSVGVPCDPNPYSQPSGACCLPIELSVSSPRQCDQASGVWQGYPSSCDPNPCPQPTGACCLPDGACFVSTNAECAVSGGTYQGDNVSCDPEPLPAAVRRSSRSAIRAPIARDAAEASVRFVPRPSVRVVARPNAGGTLILLTTTRRSPTPTTARHLLQASRAHTMCVGDHAPRHDSGADRDPRARGVHETSAPRLAGDLTFGVSTALCHRDCGLRRVRRLRAAEANVARVNTGTAVTWNVPQTTFITRKPTGSRRTQKSSSRST